MTLGYRVKAWPGIGEVAMHAELLMNQDGWLDVDAWLTAHGTADTTVRCGGSSKQGISYKKMGKLSHRM